MSTPEAFALQPTSGTPKYTSVFADGKYHATFSRAYSAELKKLTLRSMLITAALAIVLYNVILWFVADPTWNNGVDFGQIIVGGRNFQAIFMIVIGALAVTNEYSANTMRTTSLANPRRLRAFCAKVLAVFTFSWATLVVSTAVSSIIVAIRLGDVSLTGDDVRILLFYTLVLALFAVFTTGLGYLIRSTAGTIVVSFIITNMLDILMLIPVEFFRETFPQLTPSSVASKAILGPDYILSGFGDAHPIVTSYGIAWGIFLGYVIVALVVGAIRYTKSDI